MTSCLARCTPSMRPRESTSSCRCPSAPSSAGFLRPSCSNPLRSCSRFSWVSLQLGFASAGFRFSLVSLRFCGRWTGYMRAEAKTRRREQAPLYVATKMSKIRRASLTVPSAKAVGSRPPQLRLKGPSETNPAAWVPQQAAGPPGHGNTCFSGCAGPCLRAVRQGRAGRDRVRAARDALLGARHDVGRYLHRAHLVRQALTSAHPRPFFTRA